VGDSPEALRAFAAAHAMTYPVLVGEGHEDLLDAYGLVNLPTSWFIRRDGTIAARHVGLGTRQFLETQILRLL
jgi:hypothetical protein